jgi:CHAT domain-containing protein
MTPYILFFVFILGSLVQAEEKVQTDSGKNSDLEFAKLLEKKFRNDFLVSFEDHQYAVTDLLAHQKLLLLKAKAGTNTDAETFAAFTKSAMEQTLAMGLTETCALLGDEAMTEIMEMNDKGRLKDKDYFFIISLLMIHAEVENENFHYATQVAAGVRMDARSSIEKSPARDPGSIEAWDLHLKYLVGRFILPDDEIQKARKRINELISTKVSNPRTDLRQTLLRLNALEAARIELYRYDWKSAAKILRPFSDKGDQLAKAWLVRCLMYLNQYPEAGRLITRKDQYPDFQGYIYAMLAFAQWQAGAKDHDKAIKTLEDCKSQIAFRRRIDQAVSGKDLPDYIPLLSYYIYRMETASFMAMGDQARAQASAIHFSTIVRIWADKALRGTTENERLRFRALIEDAPFKVPNISKDNKLLADNLVYFKGLVVDSLANKPEASRTAEEFIVKGYDKDLAEDMARAAPLPIEPKTEDAPNWDDLRKSLPEGVTFVDFIKCGGRLNDRGWDEPVYLAVVTHQDTRKEPLVLDLGKAEEIERKVALLLSFMKLGHADQDSVKVASEIHTILLDPILKSIPANTHTMIFCPDASLSFVNFSALPNASGSFLSERLESWTVSSARDMIPTNEKTPVSKAHPIILANPDFGADQPATPNPKRSFSLQALPESEKEAESVASSLTKRGLAPKVFTGLGASEHSLRSFSSPAVIHLATHGFYLSDSNVKNPMRAGGLALAGSAKYADKAKRGLCANDSEDGILTAEEISKMKLQGTWLVSVSACESGMGRSLDGEGMLGLRRGFQQAGAQNLLLCIWPIQDAQACDFMEAFYGKIGAGADPRQAYTKTISESLVRTKKALGLAEAIRSAGAFVLSSSAATPFKKSEIISAKALAGKKK